MLVAEGIGIEEASIYTSAFGWRDKECSDDKFLDTGNCRVRMVINR